jgi:hypothetical protein
MKKKIAQFRPTILEDAEIIEKWKKKIEIIIKKKFSFYGVNPEM